MLWNFFFFATCSDKKFYLGSEKSSWAKNLWWAQHMYDTHAAEEEKIFWWENHWLEKFLSALEKIISSKMFVRWMMAVLHKGHSWRPRKKIHLSSLTWVKSNMSPWPCWALFLWPIKNNFKFISLFLLKILLIISPWSFIPICLVLISPSPLMWLQIFSGFRASCL